MGEGTLILPYIRRLGPFLGVQMLNFNIFEGFQKDEYFGGDGGARGYDETWILLGGLCKTGLFLEGISKHSRAIFLRSRYRIGIFLGFANCQLFLEICLGLILLIFLG